MQTTTCASKKIVLPLTDDERRSLRRAHIRLAGVASVAADELAGLLGVPLDRARMLSGLARLQQLGSVGPSLAQQIWNLGYRDLHSLAQADPAAMFARARQRCGGALDPCVEDVFRCAVAQARYPDLPDVYRQWWLWMPHRGRSTVEHTRDHGFTNADRT